MTITIIGILIILFLLLILSLINIMMSMFNNLLISVLKILLPITIFTNLNHYLIRYMDYGSCPEFVIDFLSGIITVLYSLFMIKQKTNSLFYKILVLILMIPLALYLFNGLFESTSVYFFNYSINQVLYVTISDTIYHYTISTTVDPIIAYVTSNYAVFSNINLKNIIIDLLRSIKTKII